MTEEAALSPMPEDFWATNRKHLSDQSARIEIDHKFSAALCYSKACWLLVNRGGGGK